MAIFNNKKINHLDVGSKKEFDEFNERYIIENPLKDSIGKGSFSIVYKVKDKHRTRTVALKISEIIEENGKVISLKNEFNIFKKIPVHKNIAFYESVNTFEVVDDKGKVVINDYCIMDLYSHGDLQKYATNKKLTLQQKENILIQILEGIKHLHQNNIIHRDLKPQNILIAESLQNEEILIIPKITDFGLSKIGINKRQSITGGTIRYSSPEQFIKSHITSNQNADLWSYGTIVFELITGQMFFNGVDSEVTNQVSNIEFINNKINYITNPIWKKVIQKCLVYDPEQRVQSADELFKIINGLDAEALKIKTYDHGRENEKGKMIVLEPIGDDYEYSIDNKNFTINPVFENLNIGKYTLTIKDKNGSIIQKEFSIGNGGSLVDPVEKPKKNVLPKIEIAKYKKPALIALGTIISISTILLAFKYIKPIFEKNQNDVVIKTPIDTIPNFFNREKTIILNKLNQKEFNQVIALSESLKKRLPNTKTSMISQLDSLKSVAENSLKVEIQKKNEEEWKIQYQNDIINIKKAIKEYDIEYGLKTSKTLLKQIPKKFNQERMIINEYISTLNKLEQEIIENKKYRNGQEVAYTTDDKTLITFQQEDKLMGVIDAKTYKVIISSLYKTIFMNKDGLIECRFDSNHETFKKLQLKDRIDYFNKEGKKIKTVNL